MKIDLVFNPIYYLEQLTPGTVFMFKDDFYLLTGDSVDGDCSILYAVKLRNGEITCIAKNEQVKKIKAKLVLDE